MRFARVARGGASPRGAQPTPVVIAFGRAPWGNPRQAPPESLESDASAKAETPLYRETGESQGVFSSDSESSFASAS